MWNQHQDDPRLEAIQARRTLCGSHSTWALTDNHTDCRVKPQGIISLMILDGPVNGDLFKAYVAQILVPELKSDDIAIMEN